MDFLSRTASKDSIASNQKSQSGSLYGDMQELAAESSGPPSPSNASKAPQSLASAGRTPSHSLLTNPQTTNAPNRKSRFADIGTVGGTVGRASISMPPPATKSTSIYKPSTVRRPTGTQNPTDTRDAQAGLDDTAEERAPAEGGSPDDVEKIISTPSMPVSEPHSPSAVSDSSLKPPGSALNRPGDRMSFSSLYSLGPAIYSGAPGPPSAASSTAGSVRSVDQSTPTTVPMSPSLGSTKGEAASLATTATDPVSVSANSQPSHQVSANILKEPSPNRSTTAPKQPDPWGSGPLGRPNASRRSRSRTQQGQAAGSSIPSNSGSPSTSERSKSITPVGRVGVCALDVKARSKASRNILTRLQAGGEFEVVIFGDKVIYDEEVENWPICDFLISFFSDGFPLDKAIAYYDLRKPFTINDLHMQKILWDRRICLRMLDSMGVPTAKRVEVNRDGGPTLESASLAEHVFHFSGVRLEGPEDGTGGGLPVTGEVKLIDDGDTLLVGGKTLKKPFVEKPISGEDHNIRIYFPQDHPGGGGGRKLFRKIGNKSSEWDSEMIVPRAVTENDSSYLYEQFLHVDNAEDIKAYTVGPEYCHAETRTSPVVDGLVRRNTHGKEIRYICNLSPEEQTTAKKIANGFGQRICGFDMLRVKGQSFVIDVNGWSFVKDNNAYYDKCASILKQMFVDEKQKQDGPTAAKMPGLENTDKNQPVKGHVETSLPHRKNTTTSHRSALKNLIKSPSMSGLRGHLHHGQASTTAASPEVTSNTTPLSSPPTLASGQNQSASKVPLGHTDQLPPSTVSMSQSAQTSPPGERQSAQVPSSAPEPSSKHSWKLKGVVSVIRHADRTPKQKFKFTFHTQPFVELLKGHQEEVLLKGEAALNSVLDAVKIAMRQGIEDPERLYLLTTSLARKGAWTGTKVQIKPMFRKRKPEEITKIRSEIEEGSIPEPILATQRLTEEPAQETSIPLKRPPTRSDSLTETTLSRYSAVENDLVIEKLQLIVKWGGEPTHSARYQSQDLGENMRNDLSLMNKEVLEDVRVFTSSERRVSTSAQIWAASFLDRKEVAESSITVRKDLLDDSNAAKDVMDRVKKKLKLLLRAGEKAPSQFAWPSNMPEPSEVVRKVAELMVFHRKVMRYNYKKLNSTAAVSLSGALNKANEGSASATAPPHGGSLAQAQAASNVQSRWCCGEDPELFKERWEKLFSEFCDSEKIDPSKISELYDTMKFDALHNRQFLEWVFMPDTNMPEDIASPDLKPEVEPPPQPRPSHSSSNLSKHKQKGSGSEKPTEKDSETAPNPNLAQRIGLRRKSAMTSSSPQPQPEHPEESYFKLYRGTGQTKAKQDARLANLRDLFKLAKVLFDFVCPQEYGISNDEKLEIGLLTSLPLLKEIVTDLEEVKEAEHAKSFIYFTKESHIYTLVNCILEGGIRTKIERNAIPELDYLSHIDFELYESEDKDATEDKFTYSIRITITPGCHIFDPLDVQLDSKHSIGCAPRRSLTTHMDWKEVTETLKRKFTTVDLPKTFLAVNISHDHSSDTSRSEEEAASADNGMN